VKYTYYELGDVSNITLKDRYVDPNATPGDPNDYDWHYDLAFYPYTNGTVAAVMWDRWRPDPNGNVDPNDPNQYQALSARGFMYDDPRAKVFDRPLNPTTLEPLSVGGPNAEPDVGRFVQRDSAGIGAGLNVFEYCLGHPTSLVDPSGLGWFDWMWPGNWNIPTQVAVGGAVAGAVITECAYSGCLAKGITAATNRGRKDQLSETIRLHIQEHTPGYGKPMAIRNFHPGSKVKTCVYRRLRDGRIDVVFQGEDGNWDNLNIPDDAPPDWRDP